MNTRFVINSVPHREVDSIIFPTANPMIPQIPRPRKIFAILMKRNRHNSIRGIKRPKYQLKSSGGGHTLQHHRHDVHQYQYTIPYYDTVTTQLSLIQYLTLTS